MSAINQFKCDSCKHTANAKYNGEHYLPPADWIEMFDRDVHSRGHLCNLCAAVIWHQNLRETKVGRQLAKKIEYKD